MSWEQMQRGLLKSLGAQQAEHQQCIQRILRNQSLQIANCLESIKSTWTFKKSMEHLVNDEVSDSDDGLKSTNHNGCKRSRRRWMKKHEIQVTDGSAERGSSEDSELGTTDGSDEIVHTHLSFQMQRLARSLLSETYKRCVSHFEHARRKSIAVSSSADATEPRLSSSAAHCSADEPPMSPLLGLTRRDSVWAVPMVDFSLTDTQETTGRECPGFARCSPPPPMVFQPPVRTPSPSAKSSRLENSESQCSTQVLASQEGHSSEDDASLTMGSERKSSSTKVRSSRKHSTARFTTPSPAQRSSASSVATTLTLEPPPSSSLLPSPRSGNETLGKAAASVTFQPCVSPSRASDPSSSSCVASTSAADSSTVTLSIPIPKSRPRVSIYEDRSSSSRVSTSESFDDNGSQMLGSIALSSCSSALMSKAERRGSMYAAALKKRSTYHRESIQPMVAKVPSPKPSRFDAPKATPSFFYGFRKVLSNKPEKIKVVRELSAIGECKQQLLDEVLGAIESDDIEFLKELIESNIDSGSMSEIANSMVKASARMGNIEMLEMLKERQYWQPGTAEGTKAVIEGAVMGGQLSALLQCYTLPLDKFPHIAHDFVVLLQKYPQLRESVLEQESLHFLLASFIAVPGKAAEELLDMIVEEVLVVTVSTYNYKAQKSKTLQKRSQSNVTNRIAKSASNLAPKAKGNVKLVPIKHNFPDGMAPIYVRPEVTESAIKQCAEYDPEQQKLYLVLRQGNCELTTSKEWVIDTDENEMNDTHVPSRAVRSAYVYGDKNFPIGGFLYLDSGGKLLAISSISFKKRRHAFWFGSYVSLDTTVSDALREHSYACTQGTALWNAGARRYIFICPHLVVESADSKFESGSHGGFAYFFEDETKIVSSQS
eukprot:gnl/MRDRNA2_/MRDRNA2_83182_c0_seq1.p1 gnl/MRDRNA2_/MRDRNA2_83182_c0~~gnl/MRDRNA2_/MRDRNA2_83182_c0_seq1.p1  ORF type:complete len:931 (+),score=110.13 gnl/MRDRNA2_/MRDRNA2_83182_c0_seq1:144-2795(+)